MAGSSSSELPAFHIIVLTITWIVSYTKTFFIVSSIHTQILLGLESCLLLPKAAFEGIKGTCSPEEKGLGMFIDKKLHMTWQ